MYEKFIFDTNFETGQNSINSDSYYEQKGWDKIKTRIAYCGNLKKTFRTGESILLVPGFLESNFKKGHRQAISATGRTLIPKQPPSRFAQILSLIYLLDIVLSTFIDLVLLIGPLHLPSS